jgi:hypothetical protein
MQTQKPRMTAGFDGATISHREFIADITGSELFGLTSFEINPGLSSLFPWLSNIAVNYETFKFTKLQFHYETAVSTTTGGSILLAVDYDAADAPPVNKREMMSYASATRSAAWQESTFNCRPSDLCKFVKERYVRSKTENGDIKTYDVGNFFIATQGTPAAEMGELYVSYTVQLHTPQYNSNVPVVAVDHEHEEKEESPPQLASFGLSADQAFASGTTAVLAWDVEHTNTAAITNTGGYFVPPAGTYQVYFRGFLYSGLTLEFLVDGSSLNPSVVIQTGERTVSVYITVDGTNQVTLRGTASAATNIYAAFPTTLMFTRL